MSNIKKFLDEFNLDKQIEKRAIIYFKNKSKISKSNKKFNEYVNELIKDENNLKKIVNEYLEENPKVKKEYEDKKINQRNIKIVGAVGVAGVLTAATIFASQISKQNEEVNIQNQNNEKIEQIQENEEDISQYDEFFEMIEKEEDDEIRNDMILRQTKEIIVEAYNMQNPNNQITADRLEMQVLNGFVIQRTDRLGNITYERKDEGVSNTLPENETAKRMEYCVFSIDGNNVATYFTNGDRLEDKTIENEETFFASTINLINQYEKLIENFSYSTDEYHTSIAENNFEQQANILLEQNYLITEIEQELEH